MDLRPDESLVAFREEVRRAIAEDLPADMEARQRAFGGIQSEIGDTLAWTRIMARRGWTVPQWPVEHGGLGWSPMQLFVFQEEQDAAYAPTMSWAGSHMVGPVIYTFGSDEQKARFLPAIRNGEYIWAQGFSEPGNGSDLANLRTQAVLDGDKYIVNGQKIWTSTAYASEWGFFLVRTDPTVKPQRGISFLLIDMKSPGITVRQIPMINDDCELCEVFLDNVEVPAENLVGEPGAGWTYAKFLLDHERTTSSFIFFNKREVQRAKDIAVAEGLARDPVIQARIARLEAEVTALEWSVLRTLAGEDYRYDDTAVASVLKVTGSRLQHAITELQTDLLGAKATRLFAVEADRRDPAPLWPEHVPGRVGAALGQRAATIFGGTLQVQKNIIAKLAFGL
ncbi:acyl-CoA dehydrogenase family protein [Sphingomonas sp. MG17]|uniref:Acyl-CoA dehydrogenase family protein n=1 Tax=Sphingomonas tagetis TaxID=2949092 RepID=A0A9X2HL80_9SPHN|nr:acyl-CoA dehydrogenase family protein [Sphingomonas tagetis]MCP3731249.1 acyl-CoA dehydrogenase family protein [Sphingomonas tagetis]